MKNVSKLVAIRSELRIAKLVAIYLVLYCLISRGRPQVLDYFWEWRASRQPFEDRLRQPAIQINIDYCLEQRLRQAIVDAFYCLALCVEKRSNGILGNAQME